MKFKKLTEMEFSQIKKLSEIGVTLPQIRKIVNRSHWVVKNAMKVNSLKEYFYTTRSQYTKPKAVVVTSSELKAETEESPAMTHNQFNSIVTLLRAIEFNTRK